MTSSPPTSGAEVQEILLSPGSSATPLLTDADVASGSYRRPSLSSPTFRSVTSVSPVGSPDEEAAEKERGGRRQLTRSGTSGSITPLSTATTSLTSSASPACNDEAGPSADCPVLTMMRTNSSRIRPTADGLLHCSTPATHDVFCSPSQTSIASDADGYFTARPGSPVELHESMAMLRPPSHKARSRRDRASWSEARPYVTAPSVANDDEACFVDGECSASKEEGKRVDFLSRLPPELSLCIVFLLQQHTDLLTVSLVCKRWRVVAMDQSVWRHLFFSQPGWAIREDAPLVVQHQAELRIAEARARRTAAKEEAERLSRLQKQRQAASTSSPYLDRLAALKSWRETLHIPSFGGLSLGHSEGDVAKTMSPLRSPTAASGRFGLFLSPVKGAAGTPAGAARRAREAEAGYFGEQPLSRQGSVGSVESMRLAEVEAEEEFAASLDWRRLYRDRWMLEWRWCRGGVVRKGEREWEGEGGARQRQQQQGGGEMTRSVSGSSTGSEATGVRRTERERRMFEPTKRFLRGHQDSVYCIRQDDGVGTGTAGKLVSGSRDRTIRVWDVETGTCKHILKGHGASVLSLQYDDQILVSVSSDGQVFVWDFASILAAQKPVTPAATEDSTSTKVQIDPECGALVHNRSDRVQCILRDHSSAVLDVVFDENWIVTGSKDATVRVWRRSDLVSSSPVAWRKFTHGGPVNAVGLQGNQVVSASGEGSMYLWDLESGEKLHTFRGHTKGLACIVFRDHTLVSGSNDQTIRVWDTTSGRCTHVLGEHHLLVRTVAYCPLRRLVVSGGYDRLIKLWSLDDTEQQSRQDDGTTPAEVNAADQQADDEPKVGKCLRDLRCHRARIFDVDFNTTRIVSASEDHLICMTNFGGVGIDASLFA